MRTLVVPFTHPVTDESLMAFCAVDGRYVASTFNEPAEYPEIDIFRVTDEEGHNIPEAHVYVLEDDALRVSIEEAAMEQASEYGDEHRDTDDDGPERDFYDDRDTE